MKFSVKTLVHVSLLVALEIVLTRFCSISTPVVRIGFGFVPIAVCAILYGPVWAGVAGALADFLGAVAFPFVGAYFPGFTLSAALTGAVFGLLLYKRELNWLNIGIAVAVSSLCISLGLSTLWVKVITGSPYLALLATRVVQNLIMIPIQLLVLRLLAKPVKLYAKHLGSAHTA